MVDKIREHLNHCKEISMKEIYAIVALVLLIAGSYNSVASFIDNRYATKEMLKSLEKKVDGIGGNVNTLLLHFGIKGIEKK